MDALFYSDSYNKYATHIDGLTTYHDSIEEALEYLLTIGYAIPLIDTRGDDFLPGVH